MLEDVIFVIMFTLVSFYCIYLTLENMRLEDALVKQRERFKLALDVRQKKIADGAGTTDDERAKV